MAMNKLALLLALAIGGLALCDGTDSPPSPNGFSCPGGGQPIDGNNRPSTLPVCTASAMLCRADDCRDSAPCKATCKDGTILTLTRNADGSVTARKGSAVVDLDAGIYKGCNAYCKVPGWATQTVPIRGSGTPCGLSHADVCYNPGSGSQAPPNVPPPTSCRCVKEKVTFHRNDSPVKDVSLCPRKTVPDKTKYTAKDNCGKTLQVKVSDSAKYPVGGPCGTITRTFTAACEDAQATKLQKITIEDNFVFSFGCPVKASSKCVAGPKEVTPVVSYTGCVFKAVYKFTDACGIEKTKTVTK